MGVSIPQLPGSRGWWREGWTLRHWSRRPQQDWGAVAHSDTGLNHAPLLGCLGLPVSSCHPPPWCVLGSFLPTNHLPPDLRVGFWENETKTWDAYQQQQQERHRNSNKNSRQLAGSHFPRVVFPYSRFPAEVLFTDEDTEV